MAQRLTALKMFCCLFDKRGAKSNPFHNSTACLCQPAHCRHPVPVNRKTRRANHGSWACYIPLHAIPMDLVDYLLTTSGEEAQMFRGKFTLGS